MHYARRKHEQPGRAVPTMGIRSGDTVIVISGKDRGKKGRVIRAYPRKGAVLVQSINFIKRHTRPSQRNQRGGVVEHEAPLPVANVMLVCSRCNKPTRIEHTRLEDGSKTRRCKKCREVIENHSVAFHSARSRILTRSPIVRQVRGELLAKSASAHKKRAPKRKHLDVCNVSPKT